MAAYPRPYQNFDVKTEVAVAVTVETRVVRAGAVFGSERVL
jgi:hypothetical protein